MKIIPVDPEHPEQVRQFLELPFQIYSETPQWVPPLSFDAIRPLQPHRHPFYHTGEAAFFLAFDAGPIPVGRIAVLNNRKYNEYNQEQTAFFYLLESIDSRDVFQGLLETAETWSRRRKLNLIIGPKGFTVLDGFGLLVKGFQYRPAFGQPYNHPYYAGHLDDLGYVAHRELLSGYLDYRTSIPTEIHALAERIKARRGLHVARFRKRADLYSLTSSLKELYNASLTGTSGNAPLSDAEVKSLADQLLWFADPSLIKVVMKGDEPVGFCFAYPDISAAMQRTRGRLFPIGWVDLLRELRTTRWINVNGAGMIEAYRGSGGTALLFSEMIKSVQESHYRYADIVQIGTENDKMQREMRRFGIDFYKTHRLYAKTLA